MIHKIFAILILFFSIVFFPSLARAEETLSVYLFYGEGCPHCAKEKVVLSKLIEKYPQLELIELEIYKSQDNRDILQNVAKTLGANGGGVPFLVIGETHFIGYSPGITDAEIETTIQKCIQNTCSDIVKPHIPQEVQQAEQIVAEFEASNPQPEDDTVSSRQVKIPFIGAVDLASISLPFVTVILALLDGFNPCAMWALLFLISLLLGLKDRKRMWILGLTFIVTSAAVYFLFLAAWLNLFLFIGFLPLVRLAIGIVAVGTGYYYLRDFYKNRNGGCAISKNEKHQQIFERLREITHKKQFFLAVAGIMALAVAVNMVELLCSAGLPAVYTQILTLAQLSQWQYYSYLLLYIVIFMLDDMVIFFTAMITLQLVGMQSKYARYSHLIGGILMLIIGFILVLRPEWLLFG